MSALLAELQAKQKARASSVFVAPTTSGASSSVNAGPPPPPGGSPSTAPRATPPPPPRTAPPPLPRTSSSVILPGPPLAGLISSSAPGTPPQGTPPAGAQPPPPPSARPPPLPRMSMGGAPPPLPPHPTGSALAAALSPHSTAMASRLSVGGHVPPPPPAMVSGRSPTITVPAPDFDAETPHAPDTPTGGHRTTGSFSSALPSLVGIGSFSPSPNPLSPLPGAAHVPPLHMPAHAPPPRPTHTPLKRQVSAASRQVYLNEDASFSSTGDAEFRLPTAQSAIKLSSTVMVHSERQESRFIDDFIPPIPAGADALVASSLTAFQRPIKAFVRTHVKYHKLTNASSSAASGSGPQGKMVEFEVDEAWNDRAAVAAGGTAGGTVSAKAKKGGGLADIFAAPPTTGGIASPPAVERQGSEGAAAAQKEAEEARSEEVAALCNLDLLRVQAADAKEAVAKDATAFATKEENLFLRAHPEYDYNEALHKAEYTICKRMPPSAATGMWAREQGHQFLISIAGLRLGIGNVEPFFGTLALYDLKAGTRLSEDFHFDCNDNSLLTGQLEVAKASSLDPANSGDIITLCPHALFSVADRHADVVLVLKLERILQGDPDEMEHYHKLRQRPSAEMAALVKKTKNNLIYLSDYRQPFGWALLPLFEETGEMRNFVSGGGPSGGAHERGQHFVRVERIFQQIDSLRDDLFTQLVREARDQPSKGGKIYPGTYLDLRLEEVEPDALPQNRVDVSCIPLKDTASVLHVSEVTEYNVAADAPLPTGRGSPLVTSMRPSIVVPPTPMASSHGGPQTPGTASCTTPGGPPPPPGTPHHASSGSISMTSPMLHSLTSASSSGASAASAAGPIHPAHTTTLSNIPIPSPPIIREIEEFSAYTSASSAGPPTPHTSYVNLLYLYPEAVKFEKFRNIACRIQLRTSDGNVVAEGLRAISGKSSGSAMQLSALTQVNYHRKAVTPQEEVKVQLPHTINSQLHLFFTFYKVSCKTKPGKREVIGMSVLQLQQKGRMLIDDLYELPIAAKLPKNYLQPYAEGKETSDLHFRNGGAKDFSVRIRLVSSIFSQDEHIHAFLHTFPNSKELIAAGPHHGKELLNKAIDHIHRINPWYTVKFLPALLDYFFELIQNRATVNLPQNNANQIQASYFGFLGLTYLVFRISEYYGNESGQGGNRCSILVAYITHRLENLTQPVVMHASSLTPHAMGVEAGAGTSAPSAGASVPYVPLYAIFTRLWLVGLAPAATSDNAALFTLPSATAATSASLLAASAPLGSAPVLTSGGAPGSNSAAAHQTLHERLLISYAWFYFEVITKSLVLERDRQMKEHGRHVDDENMAEFIRHFESLIQVIVSILSKHRTVGLTSVKHLVHNLALFFNDLFAVLEKERVVGFITKFLQAFRSSMNYADPVLIEIKFTFYHILLDFEWFMDCCEPEPVEATVAPGAGVPAAAPASTSASDDDDIELSTNSRPSDPSELISRIRAKYPLVAIFIADYVRNLARSRESMIRDKIITSLRQLLTKHDYDVRWQSNKADIAVMFLPLLPAHLDELDILKTAAEREREREPSAEPADGLQVTAQISSHKAHPSSSSSGATPTSGPSSPASAASTTGAEEARLRRNILVCVLWVLKNTPLPLLRSWWRRDLLSQSGQAGSSSSSSRESSVSESSSTAHNEGPLLDFLFLLDTCVTSFPYAGVARRVEVDTEDIILSPETVASFQGEVGAHGVADIKSDIEALMSNIHKIGTIGQGGGTLRAQRAAAGPGGDKNATLGGPASGKSTLRQLRAQLSTKNATIGPGGLNMQMLAAGAGESITGGTIGRNSAAAVAFQTVSSGGTINGNTNPALAAMAASMSNSTGSGGTYRRSGQTLNGLASSREYVLKLVQWEGYLTRSVSRIVVEVLHEVLEDLHAFLVQKGWLTGPSTEGVETNAIETFQSVLKIFTNFVAGNQATSTLLALFPTMLLFVQRYGRFFHLTQGIKKAMGQFASISFRVCGFASREVRMHAVALIYSLLRNNYALDGNLFHLQMQLTISLSKLTENLSVSNEKYLQNSISALMRTAAQSIVTAAAGDKPSADYQTRLNTLLGRLSTILSDSMEISRQTKLGSDADSATSENLLVQIADAFSHIPEIRIEWLNRLAHHHQREGQFAEAGQCFIQMADLVTSNSQPKGAGADGEAHSMVDSKSPVELDKLVSAYYEAACKMLDKAELYEQCSDVYQLLQPLYHKYRNYKSLSDSHYHLHQVFEKLMDANRKQSRMLGTYYRIGFYGLKFGERLHGNEFIYKLPMITRLSEVATRMKTLYSNQLGCPVKVLPDSNPVDITKLDNIAEECVLQITFVSPSFLPDGVQPSEYEASIGVRSKPRATWIERNHGTQAFKFSTPFTSGGKAFGSVTEQHKRNTVLYVRAEFPYILTAQSVARRVETILSPIASATEDVILRTNSLLELVASESLNAKVLTGLLAGSVATQVHGGSKEICQAFLPLDEEGGSPAASSPSPSPSPDAPSWTAEEQEKLKTAMRAFLAACSVGLEANKKLAERGSDSEKEFQTNLEEQFQELTAVITPLIREKKPKKPKKMGVRFG